MEDKQCSLLCFTTILTFLLLPAAATTATTNIYLIRCFILLQTQSSNSSVPPVNINFPIPKTPWKEVMRYPGTGTSFAGGSEPFPYPFPPTPFPPTPLPPTTPLPPRCYYPNPNNTSLNEHKFTGTDFLRPTFLPYIAAIQNSFRPFAPVFIVANFLDYRNGTNFTTPLDVVFPANFTIFASAPSPLDVVFPANFTIFAPAPLDVVFPDAVMSNISNYSPKVYAFLLNIEF